MLLANAIEFILFSNFNLIAVTDSQSLQSPPVLYCRKLLKLKEMKHISQFELIVIHFCGDGSYKIQYEVTILFANLVDVLCFLGRSSAPPLPWHG